MASDNWLNENEHRDFPFRTRVDIATLPHGAIVDFGAVMGLYSGYVEGEHTVYLDQIRRQGDVFAFEFRTTAPGASGESLVFHREITATEFSLEWADSAAIEEFSLGSVSSASSVSSSSSSSSSSASSAADDCEPAATWWGFMITGEFSGLLELLPDDGILYFANDDWVVEPARMQSLVRGYVRSINLANFDRAHITPPPGCEGSSSASSASPVVFVNAVCMQGPQRFKEGYNCSIRQENNTNSIIISASVGAGAGEPCSEVPLYPGEVSPDGGQFLSGGPACNETLKTLNGVGGRDLRILAGPGVRVTSSPDEPNTVLLATALDQFATCLGG